MDAARVRRSQLKSLFITGYAENAASRMCSLSRGWPFWRSPLPCPHSEARFGKCWRLRQGRTAENRELVTQASRSDVLAELAYLIKVFEFMLSFRFRSLEDCYSISDVVFG